MGYDYLNHQLHQTVERKSRSFHIENNAEGGC
jgi:hypothetical protein